MHGRDLSDSSIGSRDRSEEVSSLLCAAARQRLEDARALRRDSHADDRETSDSRRR